MKDQRAERAGSEDHSDRPVMSERCLIPGEDTKGRFAVMEIRMRQGAELPQHIHHWEDVVVYVLEGEATFYLAGERHACSAGSCMLLPAGCEHSYVISSHETKWLMMVAPAGLERLYADLEGANSTDSFAMERFVAVAARYGVEITGPPPNAGSSR